MRWACFYAKPAQYDLLKIGVHVGENKINIVLLLSFSDELLLISSPLQRGRWKK